MFQCCSPMRGASGGVDPCGGTDSAPPEPMLWLADSWLQKVRAGSELLADGAKDKSPGGPVSLLQRALRYWGCREKGEPVRLLPKFGIDGSFEGETADAVRVFQAGNFDANGAPLVSDGIVGKATLAALDRLVLPLPRPPATEMTAILVDFVIFPDGYPESRVPRILREANYVFNRAGVGIELGTVWGPHKAGPAACQIFEANRAGPHSGWCESVVRRQTVEMITPEARRLAAFRPGPPTRVTFYFLAPFPPGSVTPWGATFTPAATGLPFTVMIPKTGTADPVDICWHELGHCLLNTANGEAVDGHYNDHSHPIMSVSPVPGLGKASLPISAALARRLHRTALLDVG